MQNIRFLYAQKLLTIVSLLLLLALFSCKKEDTLAPKVSIETPSGGSFSVMDTIIVKANIFDNENIKTVSIYVIDQNNQKVCPSSTYSVNQSSFWLKSPYILDNLYLESGEYFLVVEASDGFNTGKSYVKILIGELARVLEDILIVEKSPYETQIYSILNQKELLKTFPFEYQDFIYNPYAKQFVFLTANGLLIAYDCDKKEEQWQINGLKSPTNDYFGSLFYKDQLTYVSNHLGEIRAYNELGNLVKQSNTIDNKGQIRQYYFSNEKIMVVKEPYVNGQDRIEELNESTGASVYTYEVPFSPEKLLFVDEGLFVVFGNYNNIAKACSLSTQYHVVHPFGDFGVRKLGDAYKYSNYYYILSLGQGILEYDLSNGNERPLESSSGPVRFRYEDLYRKLYYIDDREISILIFPASGSQTYYQNDKKIDDLIFVYNK